MHSLNRTFRNQALTFRSKLEAVQQDFDILQKKYDKVVDELKVLREKHEELSYKEQGGSKKLLSAKFDMGLMR